jgi:type VI secretion system protein ImpI
MRLTLSILRCPDRVAPETRAFDGGEVIIGRGPGADWVLADPSPKPLLSRRHCTIAYRGGGWVLTDTSTNGTSLNGAPVPEGQSTRILRDGDRLGIGPYEIEARLEPETRVSSPFGASGSSPSGLGGDWITEQPAVPAFGQHTGGSPFDSSSSDSFGASSFAGIQPTGDHAADRGISLDPFVTPSITLPDDFAAELLSSTPAPARPPAQSDHSSAFGDVIGAPQARNVLPASWDTEASLSIAPAPPAEPPAPQPPPSASIPDALPPPASLPAPIADGGLLAAFLSGAGLADAQPPNPVKAMREAGAAFRGFVRGLRRVLIARAEIKSSFRIDQTMVRSRGNNPLKFAVSDDDALAALLGAGRRSDMAAADAVEGALTDIRLHELATMAAMQEAMTELLGKLDPAKFVAAAEGGILPAQKKARAFDLYETEYRRLREAFTEKFDDAFGRAFARAYERVIADLQTREPMQ